MKTMFNGLITLFLVLFVQLGFAQEKTVSGTVSDDNGVPLLGASVIIEGTSTGVSTDFDGNYTIEAKPGDVLKFSYVGYTNQQITVGEASTINVTMKLDNALDEVVVTAQGIKREKKALGYSVASVSSEDIAQKSEGDIGRALQGKASGINITSQSGLSGSGTNIVIRGYSSFSQNNQPLFIVDGVPFSSDTNGQSQNGGTNNFENGNNGSSRFLDLDPNSIENVSILKGLSAATLYGEAGKNGVILITTKNGASGEAKKKMEISVATSVFFNEIASMPDYQNKYGNGFDQSFGWFFSTWGPSFERDGIAGWGNQSSIDSNGTLKHPYSTASAATGIPQAFPEFANARYDWKPYNSVENFFRTGVISNISINARGTSDDGKISYNANYGFMEDEGFTPGNTVSRNNIGIGGRAELSNNFTVSGTMNYSRTNFKSPPVAAGDGNSTTGSGASVFSNVFFTPRSVDLIGLPYQNPITGGSVYYRQNNSIQHPLWTVNNAATTQLTNRTFGNLSLDYDINENINILYRLGYDVYNERNTNYQNKGGVDLPTKTLSGIYETWDNNNTIWDHNIILTGDYNISDEFDVTFNLGATSRSTNFDQQGVASSGQNVFGVLRHFNFNLQNEIQYTEKQNIVGAYGQAEFGYKNYLYLTLNGRNDWVSNQSVDNRSIFYKGASASFIASQAFPGIKSDNGINYLKLRAGYGESAGFASGYPTSVDLFIDTQDFIDDKGNTVVTNTSSDVLPNPNILPERYTEYEVGLESRFFKNKISLDLSLYKRITEDLIVNRPLDPSTRGTLVQTNVGEIRGEGIEIDLGLRVFESENEGFNWTINTNFSANESEVTDLGQDTDIIVYAGFSNLGNAAIVGQPLGVIVGSRIGRGENGEFLVDAEGNYIIEEVDENGRIPVIGDPTPDWRMNLSNAFSYKNFNFSFLLTHVQGGDVHSATIATLLGRGLTTDTVDRENTYILQGTNPNGSPNTVQLNNSSYYFYNLLFGPRELRIYDGTTLRLQEVSFGYNFPKRLLEKTPFGSLSFTVSGFNLWYEAFNTPDGVNFDPNVAGVGVGNGQGFDFLNGPSSKRYGFSIKATF